MTRRDFLAASSLTLAARAGAAPGFYGHAHGDIASANLADLPEQAARVKELSAMLESCAGLSGRNVYGHGRASPGVNVVPT